MVAGVYALAASGLSIIYGVMRILNIAHGEMLLIGAYLTWFLIPVSPLLAMAASIGVLAVAGAGVKKYLIPERIERNPTGPLVVTFGLSIIIQNLLLRVFTANPKGIVLNFSPISLGPVALSVPRVAAFAVALAVLATVYIFLTRTYLGVAIRAASENSSEAAMTGINTDRVKLLAFALGSALAGGAGSLLVLIFSIDPFEGLSYLLVSFTVVILAGFNVPGIVVAALLLSEAETVWSFFLPSIYAKALGYVIFLLVLLVRPSGLMGRRREP
jgi:branched-chain amino acid transport system permease protein